MPYIIFGVVLVIGLTVAAYLFVRWGFGVAFYQKDEKKVIDPRKFFGAERDAFCHPKMVELVDELESRPFEKVWIVSHDGLKLFGRYYAAEGESRVVDIVFNGWRGSALRDGCGGAHLSRQAGHHLLLVDQRAHGESEGNVITFGILEKQDCLAWTTYAANRLGSDVKIILSGVSMGAATVLMAAALPLPPQVRGIVADCGYSSPEAIIRKVCRVDMKIPDGIAYPFVRVAARVFGRFSMQDGGAVEAVKHTRIPILIIHGTHDDFVPLEMGREIFAACASEDKELLEIADAGHGLAYFYDREAYEAAIWNFHRRILNDD